MRALSDDANRGRVEDMEARRPYVPRRRVRATVRLAGRGVLKGDLYAEQVHLDGSPGRVLERLNDSSERYLPLAVHDSHLLLNKRHIVVVEIETCEVERPAGSSRAARVRVDLTDGSAVEGSIEMPPANGAGSRTLDHLNALPDGFHVVWTTNAACLVNTGYIAVVAEICGRERLID